MKLTRKAAKEAKKERDGMAVDVVVVLLPVGILILIVVPINIAIEK